MAGVYSYPLLVELQENNIPRMKIKLVKYFQSRKSNGGDCEVEHESGSRTAVLRFRTQEDQRNVLGKASHEITLSKGVHIKMTVRLLPDEKAAQDPGSADNPDKKSDVAVNNKQSNDNEITPAAGVQAEAKGRDDDAAGEEPSSTSAVLGNIPERFTLEFLEMLVESILKNPNSPSDPPSFTLEFIPCISSAVVTFQRAKENADFVTRCPENRIFTSKRLSVRLLEVTKQVAVEDIQNLNEDFLQLYFENEGGDVENVEINEVEQSAIITFKDNKAFQKIIKKKHHIGEKEIRVFPFYKSLGTALYGKDRPSLNLPAPLSEPIDNAVWRYLKDNQSAAESVRSDLAKLYCDVNLEQSVVCLSPMPSLLRQKEAKAIISEWRDNVKSAFAQALSKFKSIRFRPESEVWEESEENVRKMLQNKGVVVVSDKASGVLSVVGFEDNVNSLEDTLCEVINKIVKRVQREKLSITQVIKMSPSVFHLLCHDGLQEKLLSVYPELEMSFRTESSDLTLTGFSDEILEANKVICDAVYSIIRLDLEIDTFVIELLKGEEEEELTKVLLTSNGINAAFGINAQKVQLLAFSDRDLNEAKEYLQGLLISQYIDVEDGSTLEKPEWRQLVSHVENANSKPCRKLQIYTTGQQVVVCGHKDNVVKVSSEVHEFLKQNAQVEEIVVVKPNTIVEYVKKFKSSCLEKVKDKVVVSFKKEAICLSGSRADVTHCKTMVEDLVSSVFFESFNVSKPALKKFFQEKEMMYVSSLLTETGCLVQLVDDTEGRQDHHVSKPVYKVQTFDGVEIAVCKADMCSYPVNAVVNSSNQVLKHDGGVAAALLKAAGHQLQVECDKIIKLRGQLKPGDSVITDAGGQLCCKKVIHVVAPIFDRAATQKAVAQLKRAVRGSLELAESQGLISVALPTISRSQGFPLDLCVATIVKAVKEHCDECDDDNLREIYLVDNDDTAVQEMEKALRREFENDSASHSPGLQAKVTNSPLMKPAGSVLPDPNCLDQVKTKEGLDVILTKGKIQNATTEVTVNTVFEDLALNKGAVSNAIFSVAGPQLQQLVNAKRVRGTVGEIIVTNGCKLKSKQVFHAVVPQWDKGQGTAEKTLSAIFKNCLEKAEDTSLTSISFPAIGTGNLGFPKNLVASLLLKEISAFSSKKQPKHLKTVVIILHPQDAQTIQAFSDEFMNEFPSASGGSVSLSSPQNPGHFSKVVSSSGAYETKMRSVVIQVVTGDITKETSEVIVNSTNETFSLKSGVSKAILDAAGQAVEAECQTLSAQSNTGMILTQPGNLKCKKILHLVGQTDPVEINKAVKDALQMCMKNSYSSVSFPAIGTGQGNVQARQVADAMFDAVIDVLSRNTSVSLKTIRIVIFQPPMLKDFHSSMLQREQKEPPKLKDKETNDKENSWFWGGIQTIRSLLKGDSAGKPHNGGDLIPVEVEPTFFHICGDSKAKVDSAKKWISDLITSDQNSHIISDQAILNLSDADLQHIVDIQKSVSITIDKVQATLTIEGFSKNVLEAASVIAKMLKKVKDEEDLKKDVELVNTVADWQYQKQGSPFQSFDSMTNFQLEKALQKQQPNVKVTVQGRSYTVAMPIGPATDSKGNTLQIKRIDKLKGEEVPVHWDPLPADMTSHAVTIKAGTPEYTEVLNLFQASCNQTVTKIERIQNPVLWKSLQIKKRQMEQRNGHQNNERRLFHGTCHTTIKTINEHGFNRSYAGKNAACYGNGTYFAINANYSANDAYSRPNQNGEKCMYLCRVLTGDFTVGKQNMITPPAKGASSVQMYDSVVDRIPNPTMFVIFHDAQACPEYLITFK